MVEGIESGGAVEEIMGRVLEAERGRAARVIQQKWLERLYRPGSSSCILRAVREEFATLRDSCVEVVKMCGECGTSRSVRGVCGKE